MKISVMHGKIITVVMSMFVSGVHAAQVPLPDVFADVAVSDDTEQTLDCMIEPYMVVDVASSTSGVVAKVLVERGSAVEKDQVLAVLEDGVEQANAKHAKTKLNFHQSKYDKLQQLYEKEIIAYHELEEAKTEVELAEHEYKKAVELLQMRTIRSPFSGVVVERYISPGELTEQQKVIKIAQINPLKVEIIAPMKVYGSVERGNLAEVLPEGPVQGPFKAEVDIVDKVIDAASGTFGFSMLMPNRGHKIPAGVKCKARVMAGTKGGLVAKIKRQLKAQKNKARKRGSPSSGSLSGVSAGVTVKTKARVSAPVNAANGAFKGATSGNSNGSSSGDDGAEPSLNELNTVIDNLISSYERGDLEQFIGLFAPDARTNDRAGLKSIRQDYKDLFAESDNRQMFIRSLQWSFNEGRAKGIGKLSAIVKKDEQVKQVVQTRVQIVAQKVADKVVITHLYHYAP